MNGRVQQWWASWSDALVSQQSWCPEVCQDRPQKETRDSPWDGKAIRFPNSRNQSTRIFETEFSENRP